MNSGSDIDQLFQQFTLRYQKIGSGLTDLKSKIDEQNRDFELIKEAFEAAAPDDKDESDMTHESYMRRLGNDRELLDEMLIDLQQGKNREAEGPCRKHITGMYSRLQQRWAAIVRLQKLNESDLKKIHASKAEYLNKFQVEAGLGERDESEIASGVQNLLGLIEQEDVALQKAELYHDELWELYQIRNRLFEISKNLFLK